MKIPLFIKKWFGYNRKERRATIILLALIAIIILLRAFLPESNIEPEDITPGLMTLINSEKKSDPLISNVSFDPGISKNIRNNKAGQNSENKNMVAKVRKSPVDLNTCDSAILESLPGIGPVLAIRILKYRNLLGGYASKEQLKEVYGLPPETFESIKDRVFVQPDAVRKIIVNKAEFRELSRMPYLEKYDVTAILNYRKLNGPITNLDELTSNRILSEEKARKVAPYLSFE